MKNSAAIKIGIFSVTTLLIMVSYSFQPENDYEPIVKIEGIEFPENIQAILEEKCMNCHNSKAKNFKSKGKLNFDKFKNGEYSESKMDKKLEKLSKQLSDNKMPPKKFLAKHPEKKLTDEETDLLDKWAKSQRENLANK